jgi:hypothetical protein
MLHLSTRPSIWMKINPNDKCKEDAIIEYAAPVRPAAAQMGSRRLMQPFTTPCDPTGSVKKSSPAPGFVTAIRSLVGAGPDRRTDRPELKGGLCTGIRLAR